MMALLTLFAMRELLLIVEGTIYQSAQPGANDRDVLLWWGAGNSGIQFVEHEVDHHAGHADIHPERVGPPRNRPVLDIPGLETTREGDQHQRHNHDRQDRVRDQDAEIHGACYAGS